MNSSIRRHRQGRDHGEYVQAVFFLLLRFHTYSFVSAEYKRMADAIAELAKSSGKPPLLFSLCEWGEVCCIILNPMAREQICNYDNLGATVALGQAI